MLIINENYVAISERSDRRAHLKLYEPCLERGGNSTNHKGVLAQYLNSTMPLIRKIYLCHACHNSKCSNPNHLYWGTPKDNLEDQKLNGTYVSIADRVEKKYGKRGLGSVNGGRAQKGIKKTVSHKEKISVALTGRKLTEQHKQNISKSRTGS